MNILGINAYHGDASACLVRDGVLVAAAEEERFRRIKHWAGFPKEAITYCLEAGGIKPGDIDHIAVNRNPGAHLVDKALFVVWRNPSMGSIGERLQNRVKIARIDEAFRAAFGKGVKARFHFIEHHLAHLGSAFFVSPFREADIVSVDGFGDFVSTMWGWGEGSKITVAGHVVFPHSLGLFYLAMTQFLGFKNYGDEYKLMGLAAYGKPTDLPKLHGVVRLKERGRFELNLDYFRHHEEGTAMTWNDGEPRIEDAYSKKMAEVFGPARKPGEPVAERHKELASSVQAMYEEAFFHILEALQRQTHRTALCLAGGCGMNSVANGKILSRGSYKQVYIQAAPGDAGGAIGAAYCVWNQKFSKARGFTMDHAYWGGEYGDDAIRAVLGASRQKLEAEGARFETIEDEGLLLTRTAEAIEQGKVVGWFQGRMEWGPRALGNRSILGDPRREDMKDILNLKIKRRESFRPFAPSILREAVSEWFEDDADVPFMSQVIPIRAAKRPLIPAVTHVDGSGRLQTVAAAENPLYYKLICRFRDLTGVPLVLNTSFNENEPIVCRPEEALDCFLRTKMDVLVLGRHFISR